MEKVKISTIIIPFCNLCRHYEQKLVGHARWLTYVDRPTIGV
ncbi:MAG: hypothetical protein ACM31M_04325 [Nitrososphaerota archaeon]